MDIKGIDTALAEQHRNTRHDAVEKMVEIHAKFLENYAFPAFLEQMLNEMTGAVMNLKQRKPDIK